MEQPQYTQVPWLTPASIWSKPRIRAQALSIALLLGMTLAGLALSSKPTPPVSVVIEHGRILPHYGTVRLRVTIEPNKANRGLWIAIESNGYAAAHYEQLEGGEAPKTRWQDFPDLPDGSYTAWVRLIREKGEFSDSATFIVGQDEEPVFP